MDQIGEIRDVLEKFQNGYRERKLESVLPFVEELFSNRNSLSILGTGTEEICLGHDEVKELIEGDWEGWGDLYIDCKNAVISIDDGTAWFSTNGTVKYVFEHTQENYDSYVNFIKTITGNNELTQKQRITFINWVLALTYHQRKDQVREYFWPIILSGILTKEEGGWKIANLHFSVKMPNFPDERFENSKEYLESYNKQKDMIKKSNDNKTNAELLDFLKSFEHEFKHKENISDKLVSKYFGINDEAYIICPENKWYKGIDHIKEFLSNSNMNDLSLDIECTITSEVKRFTWVAVVGTLKQTFTEDELINKSISEVDNLLNSDLSSQEKLFSAQRSIAYVLKECSVGINHTYPIRMTAVISKNDHGMNFNCIHFSFPFYWIFEGKL
jgi:hypothetical protein